MVCAVSPRLRWVPLLSLLWVAGCVSGAKSPRVHDDTTVTVTAAPATVAVAQGAPSPPPSPAAAAKAPSFEALLTELDRTCPAKRPLEETTLGMKESEAAHVACLKSEADRARATLLGMFHEGDARSRRVERIEAAYSQLVDDVCWASEEVQWVDLSEGTRDDGSLRGFEWLACQSRVQIERMHLLRALGTKDARGFAQHLDETAPRGARQAFFLRDLDAKAKALASRSAPNDGAAPAFPAPLGLQARREYAARFGAIDRGATELGRETCALFDGLRAETGGDAPCEQKTKRGLLALGEFEQGGEDVGP
jgi:hypothetical protein